VLAAPARVCAGGSGQPLSLPRPRVQGQIQDTLLRRRNCPECGQARHRKGHHDITIRTLFGNIEWKSPRLEHGRCQPHAEKSFSPLQAILPEHTRPEMLYLEVKWSSLLPYEVSCDLLRAARERETQRRDFAQSPVRSTGVGRRAAVPDRWLRAGLGAIADSGWSADRRAGRRFRACPAQARVLRGDCRQERVGNSNATTPKPRNPRSALVSCRVMMVSPGGGCSTG